MVAVTYIATLLAVLMQGSLAKELPPFFHVCHRSDPTIEECIIHSLEEIRPLLVTGSPEHHIPSVEPLFIQELIKEEASGLTITTTDVTAYGGSNFIVNSVSVDPDDVKITMDVELPQLKIEARYSVHGKLVILQVKGSGLFSGNITNCTSRSVLEGEKYLKDGEEYMRFTSNTMRIHIGSGNVRLEDIFREKILTDYIHVCSASDADISKCILNSINLLRPQLVKGIEELDVPPLEPLPLDEITLKRGPTSTRITATISDIKVSGASNFQILDLRANVKKNKFMFKVRLPYLYFQGKYDLDMQILLIKLKGKGPITGNFSNYEFEAVMKGNKIEKDGEEYLRFDKMKVKIHVGEAKLNLENLFGGDPILGKVSNDILSENSELFLNEIRPNLESSLAEKFTEIANKITLRFTYKELFP